MISRSQFVILFLLALACLALWLGIATWQMLSDNNYPSASEIYAQATMRAICRE